MNVVCVGHAIKETITATECRAALVAGAEGASSTILGKFLISDGGDGFIEVMKDYLLGELINIDTPGVLGAPFTSVIYWSDNTCTAVIEVAKCIGLGQVPVDKRNVMKSSSAGMADLVFWAKNRGAQHIIIGLGGSATCDGGIGFLGRLNNMVCGLPTNVVDDLKGPADLLTDIGIDLVSIKHWLGDTKISACVDVNSPLLGPKGAAPAFAGQKGATPNQIAELETSLAAWANHVEKICGRQLREVEGSGAAGGVGFALAALGAQLVPGARALCEMFNISRAFTPRSVVITAEGKFDETSFAGKAPWTIATLALAAGATPAVFCGIADSESIEIARAAGVDVHEYGSDLAIWNRRRLASTSLASAITHYLNHESSYRK